MSKTLHKQHAAAHALGQQALNTFQSVVNQLRQSADEHLRVANAAHAQLVVLEELRVSADEAATNASRQANAIEALTK